MWGHAGGFLLGAVLLILGGDSLARGLTGLVIRRAVAPPIASLSMLAFGAVVPALAVTVAAMGIGEPQLALGSVVGGAITQLGLVLGLAALIAPLRARLRWLGRLNQALVGAVVLVWLLAFGGRWGPIEGAVLVLAWIVAVVWVARAARGEREAFAGAAVAPTSLARSGIRIAIGLALVAYAAWLLAGACAGFAQAGARNPLLLGLIALGTAGALASVPASLLAARGGDGEFAVGHALGAALTNVLLLLGVLALWHPLAVAESLRRIELPALFALALAIYPMMRSDGELSRREGLVLVAAFAAFIVGEVWLIGAG